MSMLRKLLANLWSRGVALQCSFNQEAIDFLIPIYTGSLAPGEPFDPSKLTGMVGQVKNKAAGDSDAKDAMRPFALPRNTSSPLPYLAVLMELGTESQFRETGSHLRVKTWDTDGNSPSYDDRHADWLAAFTAVAEAQRNPQRSVEERKEKKRLEQVMLEKQLVKEGYNRYSIAIRGASPTTYGILATAKIVEAFKQILHITLAPADEFDRKVQHMVPLGGNHPNTGDCDWMADFETDDIDDA